MPGKAYRVHSSRTLHRGYVFDLVKDTFSLKAHPGKLFKREMLTHPGAVVVIPFVDRERILLLKQFRYAAKTDLWEVPAGTLERGEATLACAKRELEEETGFRGKKWRFLTRFYSAPGICDEIMWLYRADGLSAGKKDLDPDEWIEHRTVTLAQAVRMVRSGRIRDGKSICAILWAAHFGPGR